LLIGGESAFRIVRFSRGTGAEMDQAIGAASGRKPGTRMLPLIMVSFAIFWGLVITLIVLQDRMIDAQRDLIHGLFQVQHRTLVLAQKTRNVSLPEKASAKTPGHARGSAKPDSPSLSSPQISIDPSQPSTQVPLSQNASSETPSSQAKPQASSKSGRNSRKAAKPAPAPPPAEFTDPSDQRRVLNSI